MCATSVLRCPVCSTVVPRYFYCLTCVSRCHFTFTSHCFSGVFSTIMFLSYGHSLPYHIVRWLHLACQSLYIIAVAHSLPVWLCHLLIWRLWHFGHWCWFPLHPLVLLLSSIPCKCWTDKVTIIYILVERITLLLQHVSFSYRTVDFC